MKSSFVKLRSFVNKYSPPKHDTDSLPWTQFDELAQADKEMKEMKNCYQSLLAAASETASCSSELSKAMRAMGSCLLDGMPSLDDEEKDKVLLILGKKQLELYKLVNNYRAHILWIITNPWESLLEELRAVEEMKRQCNKKRDVYEYMLMTQQREKGKSKGGKNESFNMQQLQAAGNAYEKEAALCLARLKSLKQEQSRILVTQAAHQHAAQLNFFRKGLKTLETADVRMTLLTEPDCIDCQFIGLEDDGEHDGQVGYKVDAVRELSFDNHSKKPGHDVVLPSSSLKGVNLGKGPELRTRERRHSLPTSAGINLTPAEGFKQVESLYLQNSNTYVLPRPGDPRVLVASKESNIVLTQLPSPHLMKRLSLPELDAYNDATEMEKTTTRSFSGGTSSSKPFSPSTSSKLSSSPKASPPFASSPKINELHQLPKPPDCFPTTARGKSPDLIRYSSPPISKNQSNVAAPLCPIPPSILSCGISVPSSNQTRESKAVGHLLSPEDVDEVISPSFTPRSL